MGPIKKSLSIDRKAGKVKEEFTNQVIIGQINLLKKLVEKVIKDSSELRTTQSTLTTLTKENEKKITTFASSLLDSTNLTESLTTEVDRLKVSLEGKLDEVLSSLSIARRRASSTGGASTDGTRATNMYT